MLPSNLWLTLVSMRIYSSLNFIIKPFEPHMVVSKVHISSKPIAKIGAICIIAFLLVSVVYLLLFYKSSMPFRDGEEIASIIISEAERNGGIVHLSILSNKVCVVPDGNGPESYSSSIFFPGSEIAYVETDQSEGYWFIYTEDGGKVFIYGIPQTVLKWGSIFEEPETPLSQGKMCPEVAVLSVKESMPEILRFE